MPSSPYNPHHEWSFSAIGTEWWIGIYERVGAGQLERLRQLIAARIEAFDIAYSRFRPDSLVTRISKQAGTYELPADGEKLFSFYRQLYDITDGLVTPLIGQMLVDAGYDAHYSLMPGTLKQPPKWDDVLTIRGRMLTAAKPIVLDVGAAGKGYLVDLVSDLLTEEGVTHFCVDGGGDMRIHNLAQPLKIGLENPQNTAQAIGVAHIASGALCGSAGNRRAWGGLHHIMNPQTLQPARGIQAVWVAARTALIADGLSTALFFIPPDRLQPYFDFAYCIVNADNTMQSSAHFPAAFFTEENR